MSSLVASELDAMSKLMNLLGNWASDTGLTIANASVVNDDGDILGVLSYDGDLFEFVLTDG